MFTYENPQVGGADVSSPVSAAGEEAAAPDEIIALRLKLSNGKASMISMNVVPGVWNDSRIIRVGTRLYYEVLDSTGNILAKGFRNDPSGLNYGRDITFLLSAPYMDGCSTLRLYKVDYENAGRDEYARHYMLLGSFDIKPPVSTAMMD